MEHLPEVLKIVEGAIQRDVAKVERYSDLLAVKLEGEGDAASASHLRRVLSGVKSRGLRPADIAAAAPRVPVDTESRVALADTTYPKLSEIPVVLDSRVEKALAAFIESYSKRDQLLSAGLTGPGHVLLYGPPGCGKTQAAMFLAASLGLPLVTARLDGLISSFLGSTAKNIRFLFDFVDSTPCVLLLDEFDAVAKMRDDPHELGELKRVVNSLLQNIDLLPPGAVVVAATNHEHLLDPAVWRRFEYHMRIGPPDRDGRRRLFELYGRGLIDLRRGDLDVLSVATEGLSGADIRAACDLIARQRILEDGERHDIEKVLEYLLMFRGGALNGDAANAWPARLDDKIVFLRGLGPDVFTYDVLSRVLQVSKGKISKVLGGSGDAR